MADTHRIYLATSNPGKVREFQEAARALDVTLGPLPGLDRLPPPIEDGNTFEQNARKKAEYYSRHAPGALVLPSHIAQERRDPGALVLPSHVAQERRDPGALVLPSHIAQERRDPGALVLAEDSGLAVDALNGAPGVYSARYAAMLRSGTASHENSNDQENNLALIRQLERLPGGKFAGKYVSVIALARNGRTLATFTGEAHGELLTVPRGSGGFGYDPLFYFPVLGCTFAELSLEKKRKYSHRGQAFRNFLEWYKENEEMLPAM
jgi:XTP/dITP diphosphohydrolase